MKKAPDSEEMRAAQQRIAPYIHRTPLMTNRTMDDLIGARIYFKCENFQKAGAFKYRGACNAVFSLDAEEAQSGVLTHSSGNHAAALALAARTRGIDAFIVMPSNAPQVKIAAVKNYGGKITFCGTDLASRECTAAAVIEKTGATLIHPYNDYRIIAGQASAAREIVEEVEDIDFLLAPVSGGGLLSGTALAAKHHNSNITVVGCEPEGAADAYQSMIAGHLVPVDKPSTIADGLRASLGDKTFPIIKEYVDEIVLISEEEIIGAMQLIFERMKIIIEPSSAVALAALLYKKVEVRGAKVGVILSGGNVDFSSFFKTLRK